MTETEGRRRDRAATAAGILAAARTLLAEEGFGAFGINAVAKAAGCDKQLVYRYFGGIDGLAAAIGADLAGRIGAAVAPPPAGADYAAAVTAMLDAFAAMLRADPLARRIAAWEVAEPSPLVAILAEARSEALRGWIAGALAGRTPPAGTDAPAVNAVLIAAVQHLALAEAATGTFAGLRLDAAGAERAHRVVAALVAAAYGSSA